MSSLNASSVGLIYASDAQNSLLIQTNSTTAIGIDTLQNITIGSSRREIDYYIHDIDCYVNYNGIYWHGKNKSDEELIMTKSSQSEGIRRTKRYDADLVEWANKNMKRFIVIWEGEEAKGVEMFTMLNENTHTLDAWFASDPLIRKQKILGINEKQNE